jgi:competence protein ComEC
VVSHRDQDHVGGLDTLLRTVTVRQAYMPFNLIEWLHQEARRLRRQLAPIPGEFSVCVAGLGWDVDGVRFDFLHPQAPIRHGQRPNAQACVLLIRGQHHTALLPGDIEAAQEHRLVPYVPSINVLVAPHHGSSTSSSWPFIQATQAQHVIAQVGYLNRFHHPTPSVIRRWHYGGAVFWRTDQHGAVMASSSSQGLAVQAYRNKARRYWHAKDTPTNDE